VPDVLIYGGTFRSPELRHEVPIGIPDPFLYLEREGERHIQIPAMEIPRLEALGGYRLHPSEEYGFDELVGTGLRPAEIRDEVVARAVTALGVTNAVVPDTFPLRIADVLRARGIELTFDQDVFDARRRVKTPHELAGVRRAQAAAEAGMSTARELLRRASDGPNGLVVDGEPLTVERIKSELAVVFASHNTIAEDFIVSHGPQAAIGHHMGSGPILPNETIVIDIWPRDAETGCFADMTRTFVVGEPTDEVREWHRLVSEALDRSIATLRAGVAGRAVFDVACEVFEAAGQRTQRTKQPGKPLDEGFYHGLGHGVGLEVHEQPGLGLTSDSELVAGDVVTVEPGLYRQGVGGLRLEDLLLVTEDGAENLTRFPYDLTP
jgi:Xaa-Pro aminopeptidase